MDIITTDPTLDATRNVDDENIETSEARARKWRENLIEQQKGQGARLRDVLKRLRDYYRGLDREARLKHATDTDLMIRYLNGDQYGEHDAQGNWQAYTLQDGDFAYTIPVLVGHVEQAFSQLLKTKVEFEIEAKQSGDPNRRSLARMCEQLSNEEVERLFDEDTRQDDILNTLVSGESPRYLYWGASEKKAKRLLFKSEVVKIPGRRECKNCQAIVSQEATSCGCGASYIEDIPPTETMKSTPAGEVVVQLGHNKLHIPPPLGVQYNLSARFEQSTFVIERDVLLKKVAEWVYKTNIVTGSLSEEMRIRREQERMSVQTDATVGSSRSETGYSMQVEPVERARHFLDVVEYGHIYLDQEETLPNGKKLEAGKLLGEHFPEGMYFNFVGDTLVEVEPVKKRRKWSLVRYGKKAGTHRGTGMQIGIPMQDVIDDSFNLTYATGMTVGHPLTIVNRKFAPELPDANNMLFVNNSEVDVNKVATRISGGAVSSVVDSTAERVEGALQFILGTQSVIGTVGAPDARQAMGTATAVTATVENAALRMTGPIGQRVAAEKELRFQILENIKEHSAPEQIKELERRFGPDTVASFRKCGFRLDLTIKVVPNTDRPRSMALTQSTLMALGQMAPALANVPWGGELLSIMGDVAGIPLDIGPGRVDRREAEYRLNKLSAIVERIQAKDSAYLANSEQAAVEIYNMLARFCGPLIQTESPASMFMQDHQSFMDVYKDALLGEEAKMWPDAQKLVVIQLWMDHFNEQMTGEAKKAEMAKEVQDKITPPPPEPSLPQKIAEGLSIKYTDLAAAPSPLQAQVLQLAGLQVEPAQASDQTSSDGQNTLVQSAVEHEAGEESKDTDVERQMALNEHQHHLDEEAKDNQMHRDLAKQAHSAQQNGGA